MARTTLSGRGGEEASTAALSGCGRTAVLRVREPLGGGVAVALCLRGFPVVGGEAAARFTARRFVVVAGASASTHMPSSVPTVLSSSGIEPERS